MNPVTDSFRPIELYLISERSDSQLIDMILLVLVELLANNILAIDYHYIGDRLTANKLRIGSAYNGYQSKPGEEIFLEPFENNSKLVLEIQDAMRISVELANNKSNMLGLISRSKNLRNIFRFKNIFAVFGKVYLNKQGLRLSEKIKEELSNVKRELRSLLPKANANHKEILNLLRNRYYFLQNYKVDKIFGSDTHTILKSYELMGYNIQYELNLAYFRERLKHAHVEILHMEYLEEKHEAEQYYYD